MRDLEVIDQTAVASVVLEPTRSRVLASLAEPGSASTVAQALGETRQKVNHHIRTLEGVGLVELVAERPRRGLTERVVQATARSYVFSPAVLPGSAPDPARTDRLSARFLLALAARMTRELSELLRGAERAGKPLATLGIDTEIRFTSAAARAAFTAELAETVRSLASRYHDEDAPGGRMHRLVIASHPSPRLVGKPSPARPPDPGRGTPAPAAPASPPEHAHESHTPPEG